MLNQVYILGTVVSKPELMFEGSLPKTYLLVATESEGDCPTLVDVLVRGKHAETCVKQLSISSQVLVDGRLYFCKGDELLRLLALRVQLL